MTAPFAIELVAAQGPFGAAPYDDPAAVLGAPATDFFDPLAQWSGQTPVRRVKLVEGACNLDPTRTRRLVATLGQGALVIVRFDRPIEDDPAHPYGIDLLVFGNAFFPSSGFADDATDLNTLMVLGGAFSEPMKVSVSPGFTGQPGQDPADWRTWAWYTYENGPYADTAFPTHAYHWDRTNVCWTSQMMDFTKPVNPALLGLFESAGAVPLSVADAIDLYVGAGGGTGFDIKESGFGAVQYVKIEGLPNFDGGEIDALSAVRPLVLGDNLSVTPDNAANGTARFVFQRPDQVSVTAVSIEFTEVSHVARVCAAAGSGAPPQSVMGADVLAAVDLEVAPVLSEDPVLFKARVAIAAGPAYHGHGDDLALLRWTGTDWAPCPFSFETTTGTATAEGITNASRLVLVQVRPPQLALSRAGEIATIHFLPVPGYGHTLERTADFSHWTPIDTVLPTEALPIALQDAASPSASAFYRLRVERPRAGAAQLEEAP